MAKPSPPALDDSSKVDSTRQGGMRTIRGLDADQRREQRREQLLAAALELIARDGYANTSIEQICQAAYVGNKAFYELFDSKEDCYVALLSHLGQSTVQRVLEAMQQSPADDEDETVRRMVAAFAHALADDPRTALVTLRDAGGISPAVERQRRRNRREAAALIEAFWRRHHRIGEEPRDGGIDYHALAIATLGGELEVAADWLHESDTSQPLPVDSLINKLTAFVSVVQAGVAALSTSPIPASRRRR